jgi:hypothetical protein
MERYSSRLQLISFLTHFLRDMVEKSPGVPRWGRNVSAQLQDAKHETAFQFVPSKETVIIRIELPK